MNNKNLSSVVLIILLFACAVISTVLITYLVINSAYGDSFALLKNQVTELKNRIENKDTKPESYAVNKNSENIDLIEIFKGNFSWSYYELNNLETSEFSCEDGTKVDSEKVKVIKLEESQEFDLAFDHVKAQIEKNGFSICNDLPGAHAINRTFKSDDGLLLNLFFAVPTVGSPNPSLTVMIESLD